VVGYKSVKNVFQRKTAQKHGPTLKNAKRGPEMREVFEFLKACKTFYLATDDGGQPRVRPFGGVCEYEGRLYIVTSNRKKVFGQLMKNPQIEICGFSGGTWLRLEATAVRDVDRGPKQAMLDAYPAILGRIFTADDKRLEVFWLKDATASFCSFGSEPRIVKL
jgi:uncharacterized pyridoxamine 5'-phosphate oxidase family protein